MGLLGIRMADPRFYELAQPGVAIDIDVTNCTVTVAGEV